MNDTREINGLSDKAQNLLCLKETQSLCFHCLNTILATELISYKEKKFCCHGCVGVFRILEGEDWPEFYKIRDHLNEGKKGEAINQARENPLFNYLDDPCLNEEVVHYEKESKWCYLFLANIHCSACQWLIERASKKFSQIKNIQLDMSSHIAKISLDLEGDFAPIATFFHQIGHTPTGIKDRDNAIEIRKKELRDLGVDLGVALFCAGNIMSLALGGYLGAPEKWESYLRALQGLLFLPSLFFCTSSFFKSSFWAMKNRSLSIDHAVCLTLILGSTLSYTHLFLGTGPIYFDSLSIFIFLLLFSRYALGRVQSDINAQKVSENYWMQESIQCQKKGEGDFKTLGLGQVEKGDTLKLKHQEIVPVEGFLRSPKAYFNEAFQTGESYPILKSNGESIISGSICLGENIFIEAEKSFSKSSLVCLLDELKLDWNKDTHILNSSNKAAMFLMGISFFVASFVFMLLIPQGLEVASSRFLAIIIVACPCALALGNPLIHSAYLHYLMKHGVFVKSGNIIENISLAKNYFLDKTGTLTTGDFEIIEGKPLNQDQVNIIFSLETLCVHPIAKSFCHWLGPFKPKLLSVHQYKEHLGFGVEGWIDSHFYQIQKSNGPSHISLFKDGELINNFVLKDCVKNSVQDFLSWSRLKKIKTFILSGDKTSAVFSTAKDLGISTEHIYSEMTPLEKKKILSKHPNSIMIGDGANDILSLNEALIGISVGGAKNFSLKKADVFIQSGSFEVLLGFLKSSLLAHKAVWTNIGISLLYNFIGLFAAALGYIDPLWAAILMPLSSLCVLFSSLIWQKLLQRSFEGCLT